MPLLFDTVSSFLFDGACKKTRAVLPFKFPFHLCTLSSTSYWSSLCGWGVRDRSTYFASIRDRQWAWGLLSQPRDCHTLLQTTQAVTWCKTAPLFLYKTGYLRLWQGAWGGCSVYYPTEKGCTWQLAGQSLVVSKAVGKGFDFLQLGQCLVTVRKPPLAAWRSCSAIYGQPSCKWELQL